MKIYKQMAFNLNYVLLIYLQFDGNTIQKFD